MRRMRLLGHWGPFLILYSPACGKCEVDLALSPLFVLWKHLETSDRLLGVVAELRAPDVLGDMSEHRLFECLWVDLTRSHFYFRLSLVFSSHLEQRVCGLQCTGWFIWHNLYLFWVTRVKGYRQYAWLEACCSKTQFCLHAQLGTVSGVCVFVRLCQELLTTISYSYVWHMFLCLHQQAENPNPMAQLSCLFCFSRLCLMCRRDRHPGRLVHEIRFICSSSLFRAVQPFKRPSQPCF